MTTKYLRDAAIFFLLLTYSKTIFSLLAEETTPHYHTTSVGFVKILCNRFISHNDWQYFKLVKKHSWQGSKTGDGIGMFNDQKIHLSSREEFVKIMATFHKIAGKKVVCISDHDLKLSLHLEPDSF